MASIKNFLKGAHLTSVIITPQTVAANGTMTDGTPVTVTTTMESISETFSAVNEEIAAVNSTRTNPVRVADSISVSIAVIKVNNGTDVNPLKTLIMSYDIFKVAWTEGTVSSFAKTTTIYGTRGTLSSGIQGRGKQIATLDFESVDAGSLTVTVVDA